MHTISKRGCTTACQLYHMNFINIDEWRRALAASAPASVVAPPLVLQNFHCLRVAAVRCKNGNMIPFDSPQVLDLRNIKKYITKYIGANRCVQIWGSTFCQEKHTWTPPQPAASPSYPLAARTHPWALVLLESVPQICMVISNRFRWALAEKHMDRHEETTPPLKGGNGGTQPRGHWHSLQKLHVLHSCHANSNS